MNIVETEEKKQDKTNEIEKVVSLYTFIQNLVTLNQKTILNITEYPWIFELNDIKDRYPGVKLTYLDEGTDDEEFVTAEGTPLLIINKPEFEKCPSPSKELIPWLNVGWDVFNIELSHKEKLTSSSPLIDEYKEEVECFSDNKKRVEEYKVWALKREQWALSEGKKNNTAKLFKDLHKIYTDFERDAETYELVAADGYFMDRENTHINHPLLLHRIKVTFNEESNTIIVIDTNSETDVCTQILQEVTNINETAVSELKKDVYIKGLHPMDREEVRKTLKGFLNHLSPESSFSVQGIPSDWKRSNRFLIYTNPTIFLRKRPDGVIKAINEIITTIQDTGDIPTHLKEIVSGGTIDTDDINIEESIEEQLASVGGESLDILLSKEANKEQLEIAKRIERFSAVLVQGPPGTGKTHTIANLMGHFLAQGKNVLVTSATSKALKVLKNKIEPQIQDLCVSVLDDSKEDMEKAIDGITDYMSKHTSYELEKEVKEIKNERIDVIKELSETRKKLFSIINKECNSVTLNGESISPSKMAKFVVDGAATLSYIPGKVRSNTPIPATFNELKELYKTNLEIRQDDEPELNCDLPSPHELLPPEEFAKICKKRRDTDKYIEDKKLSTGWIIDYKKEDKRVEFFTDTTDFSVSVESNINLDEFNKYIEKYENTEQWSKVAICDGKKGNAYRKKWNILIEQIDKTHRLSEKYISESFGKDIHKINSSYDSELLPIIFEMKDYILRNGKLPTWTKIFHSDFSKVLDCYRINNEPIKSTEDCHLVIDYINLKKERNICKKYWDDLIKKEGGTSFDELSTTGDPEFVANKWIPKINSYLNWYSDDYAKIINSLTKIGIAPEKFIGIKETDSEEETLNKILNTINDKLIPVISIVNTISELFEIDNIPEKYFSVLKEGKRVNSEICKDLHTALSNYNDNLYNLIYDKLSKTYSKYSLRINREGTLRKIKAVAAEWENAIRERKGIHGRETVPSDIEDAWRWKQYSNLLSELMKEPYDELQEKSVRLGMEYRKITAIYAEKLAWYYLLKKTEKDINMKQALQGWKLTIRKIGKGTGKNAPRYREEARRLMSKCQEAVPGWIMPMNKALETLNPRVNKFDVVIVDEASQSNISALAIAYMAKKIIIVGDDKQVSPLAIGVQTEKINELESMYLHGKIPNAHLYNAKTSLYDIAATTFQPLMLREHFRCVPEIIAFSNMLSYDNKIKPLRDASTSKILPAVVNYRVDNGKRINKSNYQEAKTIVALMMSCLSQEEYKDKTFGVISLLGDEQAQTIQSLIFRYISPKEIKQREILCGNPSHFQGDERDIIFLSVVDSPSETGGPLRIVTEGTEDSTKKRYNVAASRAKDQLWVVNSLDSFNDLKPNDLRKRLIDYAMNPSAFNTLEREIEEKSESPFEYEVATHLVNQGFHIEQQWEVGAYRIDMVAVYKNQKVAIECDGERYHSGEAKVREDMERQTILERLGWRFIRIRGSEYYNDKDKAMKDVILSLHNYGIEPEENIVIKETVSSSDLFERVKIGASKFLEQMSDEEDEVDNLVDSSPLFDLVQTKLNGNDITQQSVTEFRNNETEEKIKDTEIKSFIDIISPLKPQETEDNKIVEVNNKNQSKIFDLKQYGRVAEPQLQTNELNEEKEVKRDLASNTSIEESVETDTGNNEFELEALSKSKLLKPIELHWALNHFKIKHSYFDVKKGIMSVDYSQADEKNFQELMKKLNLSYTLKIKGNGDTGHHSAWEIDLKKKNTPVEKEETKDQGKIVLPRANKNYNTLIINKLKDLELEYIDHISESNIIWVIYSADKSDSFKTLMQEMNLKYALEKRGAPATNSRKAWRIMIAKEN